MPRAAAPAETTATTPAFGTPERPAVCEGFDNDCDGIVDETVQQILWADRDGDGFRDPAQVRQACTWTTGLYVPNDCNDGDRHVFMGHGCE
jgi:hypothetical protein